MNFLSAENDLSLIYESYEYKNLLLYFSGSNNVNTSNNSKASTPSSSRQLARSRARIMRTNGRSSSGGQGSGSRSTGVIIGGSSSSRPLVTVPATYVPEELISQAEVVLQGKSRNLIIRELQVFTNQKSV